MLSSKSSILGNATEQDIQAPLRPTIIIGLGGTGKEVLLRIRRKFFERYGVTGFPIVSYLWIDTDIRNISIDGRELDELYQEVMFQPSEVVDAAVRADEFQSYFRNPGMYPHIFECFDSSLAKYGPIS